MSDSALSFTNPQTKWSSPFYYTVGLIAFTLGLAQSLYLFKHIHDLRGVFIIPYFVLSVTLALPLVILELSLSQYSQKGLIRIWAICPVLKGVGYLCLMYLFIRLAENMSILAYLGRYMVNTFSSRTGWDSCDNKWNTIFCYTIETNISKHLDCRDLHGAMRCEKEVWETSEQQYWKRVVQSVDMGFQWKNLLYLFGTTVIAYSLTFKGLVVIEKVIFWSLVFSAIGFIVLFYFALIEKGARYGVKQIFQWDMKAFKGIRIWILSCQFILNSNNLGSGGLRTLGAQSDFRAHSYMNGMMLILVNMTVTLLYCVMFYSLGGSLSYVSTTALEEILLDDESEFFSKVLRMLQSLDGPKRLWIWIFYTKVFLVVFAKCIMLTFVIVRTVFNRFPGVENYFTVISCAVYTIASCGAMFLFTSFGSFVQKKLVWIVIRGTLVFLMNFMQNFAIIYIYGLPNVVDDLHFMLGFRIPIHWQILLALSPIFLFVIWAMSIWDFYDEMQDMKLTYAHKVIMNMVLYLPFILTVIYTIYQMRGMIRKCKWENILRPTENWYLSDPILRKSRQMFSAMSMTKEYLYRQRKKQEKAAYNLGGVDYEK